MQCPLLAGLLLELQDHKLSRAFAENMETVTNGQWRTQRIWTCAQSRGVPHIHPPTQRCGIPGKGKLETKRRDVAWDPGRRTLHARYLVTDSK